MVKFHLMQADNLYLGVEQLVAHQAHNLEVVRSSRTPETNKMHVSFDNETYIDIRPEFESPQVHKTIFIQWAWLGFDCVKKVIWRNM